MTVVTSPVSDVRASIAAAVTAVPCWSTPPDDVAAIPCAVVGPPTGTSTPSLAGICDMEFPVLVIGRRYDMAEVHVELDDVMWAVLLNLDAAGFGWQDFTPDTTSVGGHEQPSYTLTVKTTITYC